MVYVASTNSIYIADSANSTIRQWNLSTGQVTTLAGYPGAAGYADSPYVPTYFNQPEGITTDGTYLYVADSGNNVIRRVTISNGQVYTLAGNPTVAPPGWAAGIGAAALFNNPLGICYDSTSNCLYVADSGNYAIRQITNLTGATETGVVTTIAGSPTSTTFTWPQGIVFDSANGFLYVVDSGYDQVFQVSTSGVATVVAGSGAAGDADGTRTAAQFNWPEGIATDNTNLYIADTLNSVIREVVISTGTVTTLAGQGQVTGSANGPGNVATFNHPMRVLVNGSATYVSDTYNETIREIQ
jgi:glucose/arabinose dehydrogenase